MKEQKTSNFTHVRFVEMVNSAIFVALCILVLSYLRAIISHYGWLHFLIRPGWWLRFIISGVSVLPAIILDSFWDFFRHRMYKYNPEYGNYYLTEVAEDQFKPITFREYISLFFYGALTILVLWSLILAPWDDRSALIACLICYGVAVLAGLFAVIMALRDIHKAGGFHRQSPKD